MAAATVGVVVFGELHCELEKAKESLKCIDENIKKMTGRDPAEARAIAQQRRGALGATQLGDNFRGRQLNAGGIHREKEIRRWDPAAGDGFPQAKRRALGPLYGRLGADRRDRRGRDNDSGDEMLRKPTVQSSVVAHPKEQKTRKDCIDEQKTDATGMARNRRMFGLLLGTLQKFRVESQQTQDKEQKRMEIEKKLEEIAEKEKEDLRRERLELFQERKRRQAELRRLEYKVELVKQHEEWEKHYHHFKNFIRTNTKPPLYYLPREAGAVSQKRLADTRQEIDAMIAEKRQRVEEEVAMLGKRRGELAGAIEVTNTQVVANEGSLAVATKRKRQGADVKNGKDDDDDDDDDSSSSDSDSSSSSSSSSSDEDHEEKEVETAVESVEKPAAGDEEMEEEEECEGEGGGGGDNSDGGGEAGDMVQVQETASPPHPQLVDEAVLPTAEITDVPEVVKEDGPVAIKAEPNFQVDASADAGAFKPPATKKEGEFDIDDKQDILDQNNLTEKEFEPIYD